MMMWLLLAISSQYTANEILDENAVGNASDNL